MCAECTIKATMRSVCSVLRWRARSGAKMCSLRSQTVVVVQVSGLGLGMRSSRSSASPNVECTHVRRPALRKQVVSGRQASDVTTSQSLPGSEKTGSNVCARSTRPSFQVEVPNFRSRLMYVGPPELEWPMLACDSDREWYVSGRECDQSKCKQSRVECSRG